LPLFFFTLNSHVAKKPAIRNIRIRKQLIYITLVVTFLIMLGHIVATIYGFLDGKTTLNSLGHLAVTLLVAGSIFGYLLMKAK